MEIRTFMVVDNAATRFTGKTVRMDVFENGLLVGGSWGVSEADASIRFDVLRRERLAMLAKRPAVNS